jgi:NADH-quinone oxidoreductase subunit E
MNGTPSASPDLERIDAIIAQHKGHPGELLSILEETQLIDDHKYLSEDALNRVADRTGIALSRLYNVATFYSFFNLRPQGDHTITVCRGTACHTKGSKALHDDLKLMLGCSRTLEEEGSSYTTPDNQFTITTVACFGQCALAPVVGIDGVIHSNLTTARLQKLVSKVSKGRKPQ